MQRFTLNTANTVALTKNPGTCTARQCAIVVPMQKAFLDIRERLGSWGCLSLIDGRDMGDRDASGRFVKGYKGGPGRPARSKEEKYLTKLSKRCTLKQWQEIVDAAIAQAKKGDSKARQWLSDYLLGKPVQEVKLDAQTDLSIMLRWDDDNFDADSAEAT